MNYSVLFKDADIAVMVKVARMRRLCHVLVWKDEVALLNESRLLNPGATDEHSNQTTEGGLCWCQELENESQ